VVEEIFSKLEFLRIFSIYHNFAFRISEAAMGGKGALRPVLRVNEPKKKGVLIARARNCGQNPLVIS
jgi:hypothetical protein